MKNLILGMLVLLLVTSCGGSEKRTSGVSPAPRFSIADLRLEDDSGACAMEVTITNNADSACDIGFAAEAIFVDGSREGYGFRFFQAMASGETCEEYGNVGDIRSGERVYPADCSEIAGLEPLYAWQTCVDGFRAEQGDYARYVELTSPPTA
jgi:hypothetical protein